MKIAVPRRGLRESRGADEGAARAARRHEDVADVPDGAAPGGDEAALRGGAAAQARVEHRQREARKVEKVQAHRKRDRQAPR